ncbi:iron chelate uptake ABC transporter family permease subunit [Paenibacillus sp. NPDC058071]|uniref:iron chelate uptake ABC transporter family permease subunit n=1 Tax=Paenibacillus sp. NPDC058071 TaxID=3346326 RepID=UPI0036D9451A
MEQNGLKESSTIRLFTRNNIILLAGCLFVTLASFLFALMHGGAFSLSISDIFNISLNRVPESTQGRIFTEIRLPLTMNTLLYGAAMGVAGILLQRATRFTVICPSTLGLVPAGILAVLIAIHLFELQNEWAVSIIGTLGAGIGLLIAYLVSLAIPIQAKGLRRLVGGLVVVGVLVVVLFILVLKWELEISFIANLQTGLFRTGSLLIPISLICFVLSFWLSGRMNGNSNDDPMWLIIIFIVLATILTGTAITTVGNWAMVGLIASNVARWLARREDYRVILPVAAMIGAVIVSVLNTVSYFINPPMVTPLHTVTGLIGLPLLVVLIWKEAVRNAKVIQANKSA